LASQLLTPLNRIWQDFGVLAGKAFNPIVLGIMYFLIITPIALITRIFGRDQLRLIKISSESYWITRSPPVPSSNSFKNQFYDISDILQYVPRAYIDKVHYSANANNIIAEKIYSVISTQSQ